MGQSWIDINNQAQEVWARQYLLKKRAGMTRSKEGLFASRGWNESEPALRFLLNLEENIDCETSSVLLKKMELSWAQQVNKHRTKKTRPVNISIQSSDQLKSLAKSVGMTKVRTMEYLIAEGFSAQKSAVTQQKKLHEHRKRKLEKCELELHAAEKAKHLLESELSALKTQNRQISRDTDKQKEMIRQFEEENLKIKSELLQIKSLFKI